MLEKKMETFEKVFSDYAEPCKDILHDHNKISTELYNELNKYFKQELPLPIQLIEQAYPKAIERIKKYAQEKEIEWKTAEAARGYFIEAHNKIVDEICHVKIGEIKNKINNLYEVKINEKIFRIMKNKKFEAEKGDKVTIHYKKAIEKIKKIYCFGNEYVSSDSIGKKLADNLWIPGIEFIKTDSLEGIKGDIVILDAVKGIDKVRIIEDIDKIKEFYPVSAHDFDLGTELKLRKAVGETNSVKIIGVPMEGDIEEIKEKVKHLIYSQIISKK